MGVRDYMENLRDGKELNSKHEVFQEEYSGLLEKINGPEGLKGEISYYGTNISDKDADKEHKDAYESALQILEEVQTEIFENYFYKELYAFKSLTSGIKHHVESTEAWEKEILRNREEELFGEGYRNYATPEELELIDKIYAARERGETDPESLLIGTDVYRMNEGRRVLSIIQDEDRHAEANERYRVKCREAGALETAFLKNSHEEKMRDLGRMIQKVTDYSNTVQTVLDTLSGFNSAHRDEERHRELVEDGSEDTQLYCEFISRI